MEVRQARSVSAYAGSATATWPSTTSLCPVRALVSLATEKSAPRRAAAGREAWRSCCRRRPARPPRAPPGGGAMSHTSSRGLVGVSSQSSAAPSTSGAPVRLPAVGAERTSTPRSPRWVAAQPPQRVVRVGRHDHRVAGLQRAQKYGGRRRHSGREDHRVAAFELAERRSYERPGRVAEAAVGVGRSRGSPRVEGRCEAGPGRNGAPGSEAGSPARTTRCRRTCRPVCRAEAARSTGGLR